MLLLYIILISWSYNMIMTWISCSITNRYYQIRFFSSIHSCIIHLLIQSSKHPTCNKSRISLSWWTLIYSIDPLTTHTRCTTFIYNLSSHYHVWLATQDLYDTVIIQTSNKVIFMTIQIMDESDGGQNDFILNHSVDQSDLCVVDRYSEI